MKDLLNRQQSVARDNFLRQGWPSRKNESWHYSDINRFVPVNEINGEIGQSESSLSLSVGPKEDLLKQGADILRDEFGSAIDYSLSQISKAQHFEFDSKQPAAQPIELMKTTAHSANVYVIAENSSVEIHSVENSDSAGPQSSIEIFFLKKNARLQWLDQRSRGLSGRGLVSTLIVQEEGSEVSAAIQLLGGSFSRYSLIVQQLGQKCRTQISDLRLGRRNDHLDFRSILQHAVEDGWSRQTSYALLDDQARGIFNGRVVIARDAQRVDLGQICRSLLLSDKAEADAKPELEIYADNVKATHGATIGALDQESLFYLRSRGLSEERAQALLCKGFVLNSLTSLQSAILIKKGELSLRQRLDSYSKGGQR